MQQGAELSYLLRHDPAFRSVRREHLVEAGRKVRLKDNVALLAKILASDLEGISFQFVVVSAAPREVVQSALDGMVPTENVSCCLEPGNLGGDGGLVVGLLLRARAEGCQLGRCRNILRAQP